MPHIVTQTGLSKLNEVKLQMGNESLCMPVDFGGLTSYQYTGFRIGLRYSIAGGNSIEFAEHLLDAFRGGNWRSNACTEWLGWQNFSRNGSGLGPGAGRAAYVNNVAGQPALFTSVWGRTFSKVGSQVGPVGDGNYTSSLVYLPCSIPYSYACMCMVDFVRLSYSPVTNTSNWTAYLTRSGGGPPPTACSQQQFLQNMEISYGGSFVAGVGGVTWAHSNHPGPGFFDTVEISWNQSSAPLEVYDVAVALIQ